MCNLFLLLLLIIPNLITCTVVHTPKQSVEQEVISYRLPNNTYPEHYNIHLRTNIHQEEFSFDGRVEITIVTRQETTEIVVHARQLTIGEVSLWDTLELPTKIEINEVEYDNGTEFITIRVLNALQSNQRFVLKIDYNGNLREDNLGFYRSSYRDADNKLVWLAATQFAATNARHAFPCYDEPYIKAAYEIYITHDSSYSALSNYPLYETIERGDGLVTSHFCSCNIHQSIQFSSYIVGFVVAKFDYTTNINEETVNDENLIEYRVYSRPEAVNHTKYALSLVSELLNIIQETVKVDYVLPKLYQVALPDFYFNAMENWGLITYREERLIFNENSAPYTYRIENSRTMAHEVAHKWFGNLVTHNWWSFVWFKEGFARFFEQYAFEKIRPEWRIEDLFVLTDVQNALYTDSLFTTRQMTLYKESPSDILALYDNIAYAKGGSFFRMWFYALEEAPFLTAVTELLNTAYFRATNEDEMFTIFANVSNVDVDLINVLRSWTHQAGYPVVTVNRNYEDGTLTLTQQKFNLMPEDDGQSAEASWSIPYNFFTNNDTTLPPIRGYFLQGERSLKVNQSSQVWSSSNWILLNHRQTGYYRVNYDENNWNLIISELTEGNYQRIPILNRAQLIDDAFNLARANKLSYKIPLRLIEYLKIETDYIPWMTAMNALAHVNRFYVNSEYYDHFKSLLTELIQILHERVGLEDVTNEPILNKYARTLAINWGCELELNWCNSFALEKMYKYAVDGIEIEPNLRSAVYCAAIRSDSYYFSHLYIDMAATKDQTERKLIINALGCSGYSTALENKLLTIFNNTDFRLQEITPFFTSVYSGGSLGVLTVIRSIKSYIMRYSVDEINQVFPGLSGIVSGMAQRVSTKEINEEFSLLLEEVGDRQLMSASTIMTAKKFMKLNADWFEFSDRSIKDYLDGYYDLPSGAINPGISIFLLLICLLSLVSAEVV